MIIKERQEFDKHNYNVWIWRYQLFHGLTWDESSDLKKNVKPVQSVYLKLAQFWK
jgi:hypothetical protein